MMTMTMMKMTVMTQFIADDRGGGSNNWGPINLHHGRQTALFCSHLLHSAIAHQPTPIAHWAAPLSSLQTTM